MQCFYIGDDRVLFCSIMRVRKLTVNPQYSYSFYNMFFLIYTTYTRGVFRTQSSMHDGAFLRTQFTAVNYFCQKAPFYIFDWVLNTPLYSHTSFYNYLAQMFCSYKFIENLKKTVLKIIAKYIGTRLRWRRRNLLKGLL